MTVILRVTKPSGALQWRSYHRMMHKRIPHACSRRFQDSKVFHKEQKKDEHDEDDYELDLITMTRKPKKKPEVEHGPFENFLDSLSRKKENLKKEAMSRREAKVERAKKRTNFPEEAIKAQFQDTMKHFQKQLDAEFNNSEKEDRAKEIEKDPIKVSFKAGNTKGFNTDNATNQEDFTNVSKPNNVLTPIPADLEKVKERNASFLSELSSLDTSSKAEKIHDILQLVSSELPNLSKESDTISDDIQRNIKRMKEIRKKVEESLRLEQDAIKSVTNDPNSRPVTIEDLNKLTQELKTFIESAKSNKERQDEEHFREVRRFEATQNFNNARSFSKHNFFTPIDERLIKSINTNSIPNLSQELLKEDDLFFPMIPQRKHLTHEFLTLVNKKHQVITNENPFGENYHSPDLVTIYNELGDPKPYLRQINKLERRGWKLIGTRHLDENNARVLVFERYVDKEKEAKELKKEKWLMFGKISLITVVLMLGAGHYLDIEDNRKRLVLDKNQYHIG